MDKKTAKKIVDYLHNNAIKGSTLGKAKIINTKNGYIISNSKKNPTYIISNLLLNNELSLFDGDLWLKEGNYSLGWLQVLITAIGILQFHNTSYGQYNE